VKPRITNSFPTSLPARREARAAFLFLLPSALFFLAFQAIPIVSVFALSLTKYNLFKPPAWIGLNNYLDLLADPRFLRTLTNTVLISGLYVAAITVCGLLIALGINALVSKTLRSIFRTVYFIPMMASFAAISLVWWYLLSTDFGVINYYLAKVGIQHIPWISSSKYALYSVVLVGVWRSVGFDFVILLAALQQVPKFLLEAAIIDGANGWQRFSRITLPMISSSLFFCITINLIDGLQYFDVPQIMTRGGPGDATQTIVMYLYETGFRFFNMGYASTMSVVLLLLILIVTLAQFVLARRWVFYEFSRE